MLDRILKAHQTMDAACGQKQGHINIMEVCGTHTVSIFRSGIRSTLPPRVKMLSGPGCPVCVTDQGYIDNVLALADRNDVIIATYGDMIRVPGNTGSLESKSGRSEIKVVLSANDALGLARQNPSKTVVFVAVGFETTTPATAVTVREAAKQNIGNFCILSGHKLVIPAMDALLTDKNNKIDAFLCPGHVSVIIGSDAYRPIVEKFKKPCVVAGFEPMQIIEGIAEICKQLCNNEPQVRSMYPAVVTEEGNTVAQNIINEIFEPSDGAWRGFGIIPKSTLKLREQYSRFDAMRRFDLKEHTAEDTSGCRCGQVLCGLIDPPECELFEAVCTPDTPVGPCMVSSEGACSAWYKYGRKRAVR